VGWYEYLGWKYLGKKKPTPRFLKQQYVRTYAKKYHLHTFVETGTYLGEMIYRTKQVFKKIYTIEIDHDLYRHAKNIFADDHNISVLLGDSKLVLPSVLKAVKTPALFWLDAHASQGITSSKTKVWPVIEELKAIFKTNQRRHVILIDDADAYLQDASHPMLPKIEQTVRRLDPKQKITVRDNIIFILR
jgi:hypothetical protein